VTGEGAAQFGFDAFKEKASGSREWPSGNRNRPSLSGTIIGKAC